MLQLVIAEDSPALAEALGQKAEDCGWDVRICRDGAELVSEVWNMTPPALLLIDINMPEVDGIQAIQNIAASPRAGDWRIRFMTGGASVNAAAARLIADSKGLDVGDCLFKPFTMRRFAEELDKESRALTTGRDRAASG